MLKINLVLTVLLTLTACGTPPDRVVTVANSADSNSNGPNVPVYNGNEPGGPKPTPGATPAPTTPAPVTPVTPVKPVASARAVDLELIRGWAKGSYVGNETLKVAFVGSLEIVE